MEKAKKVLLVVLILVVVGFVYQYVFVRSRIEEKDRNKIANMLHNIEVDTENIKFAVLSINAPKAQEIDYNCDQILEEVNEIREFVEELYDRTVRDK